MEADAAPAAESGAAAALVETVPFTTVTLDAFPGRTLSMKYYTKVKNTAAIRQRIIKEAPSYAVVNAQLIVDPFQLIIAAHAALQHERTKLKTRSVYTELIYALSPSNSIVDSISKFGVSDGATSLVLCIFDMDASKAEEYDGVIDGTPTHMSALMAAADRKEIKRAYKLADNELLDGVILNALVSRIAAKDVM